MKALRARLARLAGRSEGRVRLVLASALALIAAGVLLVAALPASAGDGNPSGLGVQPVEVDLGGQNNDCSASIPGRLPSSPAATDFRINNPQTGTYTGPGNVTFAITVYQQDKMLDFAVTSTGADAAIVLDVVVKGGANSTHFDYDGNSGPGGVMADTGLHAPTRGGGNNLFSVSHLTLCYTKNFSAVGGTVFVDDNVDGVYQPATEDPDAPLQIVAYAGGGNVVQTTSDATDGTYEFLLENGNSYSVCEAARADIGQTVPTGNTACSLLGSAGQHEDSGHVLSGLSSNVTADFGNAPEICGQTLVDPPAGTFSATFTLFANGNNEAGCDDKIGALFEDAGQLSLPLLGAGEAAGIGIVDKTFPGGPTTFVPLQYSQGPADPSFEDVPWCGLRAKAGADGNQFDPYLDDDTQYPSLSGITDPDSGDPSVACKVAELEGAEGVQTTVMLIQSDPFWI